MSGLRKMLKVGLSSDAIDQLLVERADAKANRDFARADAIRDELQRSWHYH